MGCAASSDRAERRRRARALGHSEASTTGLLVPGYDQQEEPVVAWKRRGCKVAPEPNQTEEPAMPGSPSFRYYCQKQTAAVDALVAEADFGDGEGSVRITETSQAPKTRNELIAEQDTSTNKIVEASKPKQATKWLRFRGLAIVAAAWFNLFSRHRGKASTPSSPSAAKSHHPSPDPHPAAALQL